MCSRDNFSSNVLFLSKNSFICNSEIVASKRLTDPYPNPLNPITQLNLNIPVSSDIKINIYDVNGNRIFDPYVIVESDDIYIGIIGPASSFTHSDIFVKDPMEVLSDLVNKK